MLKERRIIVKRKLKIKLKNDGIDKFENREYTLFVI